MQKSSNFVYTDVWTKLLIEMSENTVFGTLTKQENSAKLTNQRVSYAFTSSPFSFHVRHILPTSKL